MALVDAESWGKQMPVDHASQQQLLEQNWDDEVLKAALALDQHKPWEKKRMSFSTIRAKRKVQDLKAHLRKGIPDRLREEKWQELLETAALSDVDRSFAAGVDRALGTNANEVSLASVPLFAGEAVFDKLALSGAGVTVAVKIMHIIVHDFPQLTYCPFVPPMVTLLLHHASADGALACITTILRESVSAHEWRYFPCSHRETMLFTYVFIDVVKRVVPGLWSHIRKIGASKLDWAPFWRRIFSNLFIGYLPLRSLLILTDSFCLEGCKIIFRVGLGVLGVLERRLINERSLDTINNTIIARLQDTDQKAFSELFDKGLSYSVQRTEWYSLRLRNQQLQQEQAERDCALTNKPNPSRLPELSTPSSIITMPMLKDVWTWIPSRFRHRDLDLVFSTKADGYSMQNMFVACGTREPLLMVVRTTTNKMFGAYFSDAFSKKPNPTDKKYYGTGECFVFQLGETVKVWPWARVDRAAMLADRETPSEAYPVKYRTDAAANDVNSYFIFADLNSFSLGGGKSGPTLSIGDEFRQGRSQASETFANEPLAGEQDSHSFECAAVEVFAFT